MKTIHWKIIAGLLAVILGLSIILYCKGFRQPTPNPDAPSFADSIREHQRRAEKLGDTAKKYRSDYEKKIEGYRKSADPDSAERAQLGANIEASAKADSIRRGAPR